jgi:hypothetical protein
MSGESLGNSARRKVSNVSRELFTGCTADGLGNKGSVGLSRVKSGCSHYPWSMCIEGTRIVGILNINYISSAAWRSLIFSLLVKIPRGEIQDTRRR